MKRTPSGHLVLLLILWCSTPSGAQNSQTGGPAKKTWMTHFNGRKPVYSNPDLQSNTSHVPPDPDQYEWFITNMFDGKKKLADDISIYLLDPATRSLRFAQKLPDDTRVYVSGLMPVSGMNYFGIKLKAEAPDEPMYWVSGAFLKKVRKEEDSRP